ncbi:probable serine/threonine-protein kinase nek3 [Mytilus trossulus]|uniref:probable serine/threonine-protein kinase nek3 n=1 Tax=Mytilus trossulus TaxID=6551 RepID=UPI0030076767
MMADVLMERGYSYHAMFIYNKPKLKNNRNRNQDFQVSFDVVKYAADKLASRGIRQTYYHDRDALPGSNIFGEFFDTVKASRYTVVVLTRGFLNDCWGKYKSQAAFSNLIEQDNSKRFIVLNIDLEDQQIPDEFNTMESLSFKADWQSEHTEWERFINIFTPKVRQPVQDTGPDRFPVTYNNSGSDSILNRRENVQHPQASLHGNNLLAGVQETNPPNYPRANSIVETDAGPQEPPETADNLHPENPNTTNRSGNGNPSNQQSGGGNQHSLGASETQSEGGPVIYQRTSTNGLNSNNSSSTSSSSTSSLLVENGQSSTQTGPDHTLSVATPPTTVMSTTGNNIEEPAALAVASAITAMQNSGTRAQAVASVRTAMQNSGTRAQTVASTSTIMHTSASREPPDGAATLTNSPFITMHNSSDTNVKNIVGRDNGNEDYPSSSLNRSDVEPDNNSGSVSNSTDNQLSTYPLIRKSHTCPLPPEQLVCPKDKHSNSQHDSGYAPSLDLQSVLNDHQETNGFTTSDIGINRPTANSSAPLTSNRDGCKSMDRSAKNSQGTSLLLSTMRQMLPGATSTMRNTVGTMFKHSVNFVNKCDQSFI